jgi:hypothetical protein
MSSGSKGTSRPCARMLGPCVFEESALGRARWTSSTNLANSQIFQNSSGLIGIGTTNPSRKLQVNGGNILVTGSHNFTTQGDLAYVFPRR